LRISQQTGLRAGFSARFREFPALLTSIARLFGDLLPDYTVKTRHLPA
jgi:hypothetical protein